MPPAEDIQQYLTGAWRLMMGKPDGIRLLDISADGFWNSFFAIVVSLPALVVGWVAVANELSQDPDIAGGRFSIFLRLGLVDIGAWVLPLAALALVAKPAGIGGRFVHYVVATNWGSALIVWSMLPPALLRLFFPSASDTASVISLVLFVLSLVLSWRLTNMALGRGPAIASAVFAGMFAVSLAVLFGLQAMFGLAG
ncbi:transporter [Mesorhizobium sp. ZC-5]|uniref:transporter n=1 Tax=Mesorhizobium sp. ZC-5 TaxID=2986066 RepID=UPI0021E70D3F|nr:transporter [Mesorhizobium sp. ZC-5]MCV3239879.1 transporter [Mesorhizobium sp. ZC-5]